MKRNETLLGGTNVLSLQIVDTKNTKTFIWILRFYKITCHSLVSEDNAMVNKSNLKVSLLITRLITQKIQNF